MSYSKSIIAAELIQLNNKNEPRTRYELSTRFTFGNDLTCDVRVEPSESRRSCSTKGPATRVFCVLLRYTYPENEVAHMFRYKVCKITEDERVFRNGEEVTVSEVGAWLEDKDMIVIGRKQFQYNFVWGTERSRPPRAVSHERNGMILRLFESSASRKSMPLHHKFHSERISRVKTDVSPVSEDVPPSLELPEKCGESQLIGKEDENRPGTPSKASDSDDSPAAPARKILPALTHQSTPWTSCAGKDLSSEDEFDYQEAPRSPSSPTVRNLLDQTRMSYSDDLIEAVEVARRLCDDVVERRVLNTSSGILRFINQLGERATECSKPEQQDCDVSVRDVARMLVNSPECDVCETDSSIRLLNKHKFEESMTGPSGGLGRSARTSTPIRRSAGKEERKSAPVVHMLASMMNEESDGDDVVYRQVDVPLSAPCALRSSLDDANNSAIQRADRELYEMLADAASGEDVLRSVDRVTASSESPPRSKVVDIDMLSPIQHHRPPSDTNVRMKKSTSLVSDEAAKHRMTLRSNKKATPKRKPAKATAAKRMSTRSSEKLLKAKGSKGSKKVVKPPRALKKQGTKPKAAAADPSKPKRAYNKKKPVLTMASTHTMVTRSTASMKTSQN